MLETSGFFVFNFLSFYIFVDTYIFSVFACLLFFCLFFQQKKVSIFCFYSLVFLDIILFWYPSWTTVFFLFFYSLIVLFECISFFGDSLWFDYFPFLFSPLTFFLQKKKEQNHLFFNCFSFLLSPLFEKKKRYFSSVSPLHFSERETFHHVFSFFLLFSSFQQTLFHWKFCVYSFWSFLFLSPHYFLQKNLFNIFPCLLCLFNFLLFVHPLSSCSLFFVSPCSPVSFTFCLPFLDFLKKYFSWPLIVSFFSLPLTFFHKFYFVYPCKHLQKLSFSVFLFFTPKNPVLSVSFFFS